MPGYLEDYGVVDAQREKKTQRLVFSLLTLVIGGSILFFTFRDYRQESVLKQFLNLAQKQDYKAAYTLWGCTMEVQCRDYSYAKFLEDWGPAGANTRFITSSIRDTERCGNGYMGSLHKGNDELALWVDRDTNILGYAPWQQCPEKKLRLMRWLRMRFGIGA
ncbi:MAG: hypothetical protein HY820_07720 [Acidobacteria bacterium]|nr:hypothetical protein [Acidobacteriota bacterium]